LVETVANKTLHSDDVPWRVSDEKLWDQSPTSRQSPLCLQINQEKARQVATNQKQKTIKEIALYAFFHRFFQNLLAKLPKSVEISDLPTRIYS